MIENAVHPADTESVEALLRDELARGDAVAGSVLPILRYLAGTPHSALFGEEVLTRTRAMLADLAGEILDRLVGAGDGRGHSDGEIEVLTRAFLPSPVLLGHVHALALEWQLTESLQARAALDPVASPLLQGLVSCADADLRAAALAFLAAQARWCQVQRRMGLPLGELPAPVFDEVLAIVRKLVAAEPTLAERARVVEAEARRDYAPDATRLGLAQRVVRSHGNVSALRVTEAGAALFLTALALGSGQTRDAAVVSTQEGQGARLALVLRAAGLEPVAVEEQFLAIHPQAALPSGFERLAADHATAILSSSSGA
jgi:hypothetical protein